jgi:hypothetical protein
MPDGGFHMEWSLIILHHKTFLVPESSVLDDGLFYGAKNPVVLVAKSSPILVSYTTFISTFFYLPFKKR